MMNENNSSNLQVIKIGALVGIGAIFLPMLFYLPWAIDMLDSPYRENILIGYSTVLIITLPGIPFGIGGALVGSKWKKTRRAAWIGAILGTLLGVATGFLIVMFIAVLFAQ
jgi:hypothetical protein